jgi:hypothetical protein
MNEEVRPSAMMRLTPKNCQGGISFLGNRPVADKHMNELSSKRKTLVAPCDRDVVRQLNVIALHLDHRPLK